MRTRPLVPLPRILSPALFALLCTLATAPGVAADPTTGFREDWSGTSLDGWGGGAVYANPGADGADGASDGYLHVSLPFAFNFGARSVGSEYAGNWIGAGIARVRIALNDVGADDPFEIHFCIGNASNFWQYNPGFDPPLHAWQDVDVDLSSAAAFTQIIGSGSFTEALQHVDRVLIRHDLAPYLQSPDDIAGDLGIDRLELIGRETPALASSWGGLKSRYR